MLLLLLLLLLMLLSHLGVVEHGVMDVLMLRVLREAQGRGPRLLLEMAAAAVVVLLAGCVERVWRDDGGLFLGIIAHVARVC